MFASSAPRIAPQASTASAVAELFVDERERDARGIALPAPEAHLVVRFGPPTRSGLDVHVMGGRQKVHRKTLPRGQRIVAARLHLGAAAAVLGVPDSAVAGRVVALEELWGSAATRRLCERLAAAPNTQQAAVVLEAAIAERLSLPASQRAATRLVLEAAARLGSANVTSVAGDLGVSERHLRRIFREAIGVGPKTFSMLTRFRHALRAARDSADASWATIAAAAGYYDQAHLISDFRAISGVTPQALLGELRAAQPIA